MKKQLYNIVSILILAISITVSPKAFGGKIANEVKRKQSTVTFREVSLLRGLGQNINVEILNEVKNYTEFGVDPATRVSILKNKPETIRIFIPGINRNVLLYRSNPFENLEVITSSGNNPKLNEIVNYRGIIENDDNSLVGLSITEDDFFGFVSDNTGNHVLAKVRGTQRFIIYNDRDLLLKRNFDCSSITVDSKSNDMPNENRIAGVKCVNWYYETDYDIFVNKGSVANVVSYIQGAFAQVATLYENDGMNINLRTIFVWDTTDPYTATSTTNLLSQFGSYRTSFNGDLALLCGYVGNGGVAYVNTLCNSNQSLKMAYCDINPTYSLVPTYSWTIEVLAHEQGHNVASRHTHDCAWNGNNTAIDGCGPTAGYTTSCAIGPLPTNGGTIMSYCHLVSGVGINFSNGFGPQPTSLMQTTIASKSCLFTCDSTGGCTVPGQPSAINGSTTVCPNRTYTYSVAPDSNATSYVWQLPSGWSGSSFSNTINVTTGTTSGNISAIANNSCGQSLPRTLSVSISNTPAPTQPSTITGPTAPCSGTTNTYSVLPDSNATSYVWQLLSGWTGSSTTNTIAITAGSSSGNIAVYSRNYCGNSPVRTLGVTGLTAPATPGTIVGQTGVCKNQAGVQYSVSPVANATSYTWTVPQGAVITSGANTNAITVTFGTRKGKITVKANNSCGSSGTRTLNINLVCRVSDANPENYRFQIIPNPNSGTFNLEIESVSEGVFSVLIKDLNGKTKYEKAHGLYKGKNTITFNINEYASGIYILEIANDEFRYISKIIKE